MRKQKVKRLQPSAKAVRLASDVREIIYHSVLETINHKPTNVTVCLLHVGGHPLARGVSFCSDKDEYMRKFGLHVARQRANKAIRLQASFGKLPRYFPRHTHFFTKGEYKPVLRGYEVIVIQKIKVK